MTELEWAENSLLPAGHASAQAHGSAASAAYQLLRRVVSVVLLGGKVGDSDLRRGSGRPPLLLPVSGRECPVLFLDIDTHQRARPVERVRDDDPHAFATTRRRRERNALLTIEHETPTAPLTENDPVLTQEPSPRDLPSVREAGIAIQRPGFRPPRTHD